MKWFIIIAALGGVGYYLVSSNKIQFNPTNSEQPASSTALPITQSNQREAVLCRYGQSGEYGHYKSTDQQTAFKLCQDTLDHSNRKVRDSSWCFPQSKCP